MLGLQAVARASSGCQASIIIVCGVRVVVIVVAHSELRVIRGFACGAGHR